MEESKKESLTKIKSTNSLPIALELEKIELPMKKAQEVLKDALTETVGSSMPIFGKILEFTERVNQGVREEKLNILFQEYSSHFESIDQSISNLSFLLVTRSGQILFQKVVQILDNNTEEESIKVLANVLKNIKTEEIEKHFQEYSYTLSQIGRLTSQALIVLSKHYLWETVSITNTTTTSGQTVSGDWDEQAAWYLYNRRPVKNPNKMVVSRMSHSFRELHSAGIITLSGQLLKTTDIGREIYRMISK